MVKGVVCYWWRSVYIVGDGSSCIYERNTLKFVIQILLYVLFPHFRWLTCAFTKEGEKLINLSIFCFNHTFGSI